MENLLLKWSKKSIVHVRKPNDGNRSEWILAGNPLVHCRTIASPVLMPSLEIKSMRYMVSFNGRHFLQGLLNGISSSRFYWDMRLTVEVLVVNRPLCHMHVLALASYIATVRIP